MQPDKWLRSLDLTSVFTPSEVDRKRVTSFMHSLNPALYLLRTVASAESAAGREIRDISEALLVISATAYDVSLISERVSQSECHK